MFERFTERARQVVVLAQEEARSLNHGYIGTEHILLGLVREEEGVAARVLNALGITIDGARSQVMGMVAPGEGSPRQMPFTPRAKNVLEAALLESLSLGHNYIGTEHILLGLAGESEGVAARILLGSGADSQKIRNEVIQTLSGSRGRLSATLPRRPWPIPRELFFQREITTGSVRKLWTRLAPEIHSQLGREPDAGDLLLVLASSEGGLISNTLAELGIDDRALAGALEQARASGPSRLEEEIEETRRAKEEAIENRQHEQAARLREKERRLVSRRNERDERLLTRLRARLGLSEEPGEASPLDSPS